MLIGIVRTRNNKKMRDKNWELQEATWGIQDNMGWDDAPEFGAMAPIAPPPQITPQVENDLYSLLKGLKPTTHIKDRRINQQSVLQPQMPY